jgi:hypothetical protein
MRMGRLMFGPGCGAVARLAQQTVEHSARFIHGPVEVHPLILVQISQDWGKAGGDLLRKGNYADAASPDNPEPLREFGGTMLLD